jgi:quinol monooxygenase YgiN
LGVIRSGDLGITKIILQGYIIVPDADLAVVKNELIEHKKLTQQESGCIIFNVTQDLDNINRFNVYEEFIDQQAFDRHQLRVKNSEWGKITVNVQRHYKVTNGAKNV